MESFEEYVTEHRIIECVCRKRVSEANKRHEAHHRHAISLDWNIPEKKHKVYQLTPPRRQWIQLGERGRLVPSASLGKQTISTADRTYRSCLWTIERDMKMGEDKPYLKELSAFVSEVMNRIRDPHYVISTPETIPIFKKRKKEAPDEYRPICLFSDLCDAIIIILANRYLSRLFDNLFYEDSLAFRPKRVFHGKNTTTFHHEAISLVLEYLERVKKRTVYVAECDMQKFYDTVDHEIVMSEFKRLLELARKSYPEVSFDAISRIFASYLNCYTFTDNVWRKNGDRHYWAQFNIPFGKGAFGWVKDYQDRADSPEAIMPRVGVPQGGALSGLIANIVINRVDEKIKGELKPRNDLYIRYCDDMLLMSTNRIRCGRLFRLYSKEIKRAKLIPHPATPVEFGTSKYWDTKTKSVYQWIDDDLAAGSNWIGFVGYEISRAGDVRIRKSSLKKEKRKQRKVVNNIFALTYKKHRVEDDSLEFSYRGTLMSMAVGRATLWNYKTLKNEFCWINGFRMLNDNSFVKTQIRDLDRCRNKVINKANKRLGRLLSEVGGTIPKEGNGKKRKKEEERRIRYYGLPFSYYYHYRKRLVKE